LNAGTVVSSAAGDLDLLSIARVGFVDELAKEKAGAGASPDVAIEEEVNEKAGALVGLAGSGFFSGSSCLEEPNWNTGSWSVVIFLATSA